MMSKKISFFIYAAFVSLQVFAQDEAPATLVSNLNRYQAQHLQEKLFIHTDKDFYLAGEICWFKLYVTDAATHHPLDLSKAAYLEWLDKDNKPVLQTKVGLQHGHGDGSLYLPLTLHSGHYKLRAYTSWMKNDGADWFFEKNLTIVNARRSAETPVEAAALQYSLALFPEGGNLVENISSKVAFTVTDQYGRGVDGTGVVTEDDQDTVVRFQPYRFGAGSFVLTPRSGHHYRSTIRLTDGTAVSMLLPAAYKEGTVMQVTDDGSQQLNVTIQSTFNEASFYLIAHTRQSVKVVQSIVLKKGKNSMLLDKTALGEGISHLTLFNTSREPLCERLVFRQPSGHLHIDVHTDKEAYATRAPIHLQLSSSGTDNSALPADCSLAVFRIDSLQSAPADHIGTYLWLTSDLKGKIEQPSYYFDHPEDKQAMDNLMMTHGWRRFRWEDALHNHSPLFDFLPEYNGVIITGKVVNTHTGGVPGKPIQVYCSSPGTHTQFTSAFCDNQGRVKFELPNFYGGQAVIAQTGPDDTLYRVDIDNPFSELYTTSTLPPFSLPAAMASLINEKSIGVQVLNRYAGEKLQQFFFNAPDTNTFYYQADRSYALDDYTRFTTMEEVLREYVTLMRVIKEGGHFHLPFFDMNTQEMFYNDPLILLDGVPVFNIDELMALDPLKLKKLDMIHRKYFLGATHYDGVMNWISYKGDLAGYAPDPHATILDYEGLQLQRSFYSPSYEEGKKEEEHLPDFRNVLYWAPEVTSDSTGKGALSFYTSDIPGKYAVVVEGLTADGRAGSQIIHFEVTKQGR